MRNHTSPSRNHAAALTLGIAVGLLFVLAGPPLAAAPPHAKKRHTVLVMDTSVTKEKTHETPSAPKSEEIREINVLEGLRTGQLSATGEGLGDGRITLSITNRTNAKLRVVLPPGLIASGATGQFAGMGGFGGGMGGMGGGMGMGGMGGMGGGMGMGGMGMGGMGGMGRGGMMGRGMGGGTLPASMGMMMLGRLIMNLIGDRDSWDQRSLMMGMMGGMGMGGMGMGGMGMGGMGGMGMMGGMGGGFRSVPPTGLPETTLQPHQVRHLPTAVVSMNGPNAKGQPVVPEKGEKLQISGLGQWTDDVRTRTALTRLAEAKAPQTVAQMALWYVVDGASWDDIGRLSQGWGNAHELALAQRFVAGLSQPDGDRKADAPRDEPGRLYWDVTATGDQPQKLADGLRALWKAYPVLGLKATEGVPESPDAPALACRLEVTDTAVDVKLAKSHPSGTAWVPLGGFTIKLRDRVLIPAAEVKESPAPTPAQLREREAARLGDAVAEGVLARLVRVHLSRGPRVHGKETYKMKIVNESPLILNGLALGGETVDKDHLPSVLAGFCLPPLKRLTVPATAEMVERLHLKDGVRVIAADLSGL